MELFGSVVVLVGEAGRWPAACRRLRDEGLYPQALPVVAPGAAGHRGAWLRAVVQDHAVLVLDGGIAPLPGLLPGAAAVAASLEGGWHVLHLDAEREGSAYVVTPEGADLLLDGAPLAGSVAEAFDATGPLEVLGVERPLAVPAPAGAGDGEPEDDLDRVLRYRSALAGDTTVEVVGDEIVALGFWTPEQCAAVVRAAEAVGAWGSDDLDPVPGHELSLAVVSPRLYAHVEDHVAAAVVPALREQWPTLEFHGLRDAFVIRYTEADGHGLRLHHDVAQISASVRLNDGYAGGELVFPRQEVSNRGLAVGRLLAWPSLVTHPHVAEPVERGVKYGLTLWFEVPGAHDPDTGS